MDYKAQADADSMLNTPASYSMYVAGLVFKWLQQQGGLVSIEKLKEVRPYVIVGAFIIGAIFTPPDVISQLLLAVPLCLLYEMGIFVAHFVGSGSRPASEEPAPAAGEEN